MYPPKSVMLPTYTIVKFACGARKLRYVGMCDCRKANAMQDSQVDLHCSCRFTFLLSTASVDDGSSDCLYFLATFSYLCFYGWLLQK